MIVIRRSKKNPILKPDKDSAWESAVFNGCPIQVGKKIHFFYRALSAPHYHGAAGISFRISDIGHATSADGLSFKNRERFIIPEESWERFGCEDPRITKLNGNYYIFYTALSQFPPTPQGIKVGLAISKDLKSISSKHLITPFNAKAMALFPEKINGKMCALLTAHTDMPPAKIALAYFKKQEDMWSAHYWKKWHNDFDKNIVSLDRSPDDQVEVGAPPIKTKYGWLILYAYIRNYRGLNKIFGIEAALLDLKNPQKIIGRTAAPLMIPEEEYEIFGEIPSVIFPSGALVKKDMLSIYYGATDSSCCVATTKLSSLIQHMIVSEKQRPFFERAKENPIIIPNKNNSWESKAIFNPAAISDGKKIHIIYRAMSEDNTSVFGYASTTDGVHVENREEKPIYIPREDFEKKLQPGGNSGCEDPRVTKIGDSLYMCYTAYDGKNPPRVALTHIGWKQFLNKNWSAWKKPVLISPPGLDNKDACIFPVKIKNNYLIFHRIGDDIDIAFVRSLSFDGTTWLEERRWLRPRRGWWDGLKIGIVAPPFKTSRGWVLLYHGVSETDHAYRVGAVLLDTKNPTRIIGRTDYPLFEPQASYEKNGQVPNVVFPCGNVVIGKRIFIYYGGGDSVVGVASIEIKKLLNAFQ